MSNPTEIIMYRNPAEYALWNSGLLFPIIAAAVAAIAVAWVVGTLCSKASYGTFVHKWAGHLTIAATSATFAGILTWLMV